MGSYEELFDQFLESPEYMEQEIEKAVKLDPNHLIDAMYRQPTLMMTWSYMASIAQSRADKDKYVLNDVVLPRVRDAIRTGAGKITVQAVEDLAAMNPDVTSAADRWQRSQRVADILRKVEFALQHKRDMIQTINSRQRMELQTVNG